MNTSAQAEKPKVTPRYRLAELVAVSHVRDEIRLTVPTSNDECSFFVLRFTLGQSIELFNDLSKSIRQALEHAIRKASTAPTPIVLQPTEQPGEPH